MDNVIVLPGRQVWAREAKPEDVIEWLIQVNERYGNPAVLSPVQTTKGTMSTFVPFKVNVDKDEHGLTMVSVVDTTTDPDPETAPTLLLGFVHSNGNIEVEDFVPGDWIGELVGAFSAVRPTAT